MKIKRLLQLPILGFLCFTLVQLPPVFAQNRILIVVNDEPITSYDITQTIKTFTINDW